MSLRVGLAYDLKSDYLIQDSDPRDINAEFDAQETVDLIAACLKEGGNEVTKIGNARNLLDNIALLKSEVDIVFNICEGYSGRNREAQVPILLEMFDIPFIGSDGLTLSLTLDKVMSKKVFIAEGIPTPKYFIAEDFKAGYNLDGLKFPLIVKPKNEGSSKGLNNNSRVQNIEQLKKQIEFVVTTYNQPALVEEFITGMEFTVPIIGNKSPVVFSPVQVHIGNDVNLGDRFYTFDFISSDALGYVYPAKISQELRNRLCALALRTYEAVGSRDFGRVDFRMDYEGNLYVLEINPLPSLAKADVFTLIAKEKNLSYAAVINQILHAAVKRYGLDVPGEGKKDAQRQAANLLDV